MDELLKKLLEASRHDTSSWVQVGTLNEESKLLKSQNKKKTRKTLEEAEMLFAKIEALRAQHNADAKEYWNKIYKIHSLPVDGIYTITKDDKILMEPRNQQGD